MGREGGRGREGEGGGGNIPQLSIQVCATLKVATFGPFVLENSTHLFEKSEKGTIFANSVPVDHKVFLKKTVCRYIFCGLSLRGFQTMR